MPITLNAPRTAVPRPPRFDHRRIMAGAGRLVMPSWVLSLFVHGIFLSLLGQTLWRPAGFGSRAGEGPTGIIADHWNGGADGLLGDGTGQPQGAGMGIFAGPAGSPQDTAAPTEQNGDSQEADDAAANPNVTANTPRKANSDPATDEIPVPLDLPAAQQIAMNGSIRTATDANHTDARQLLKPRGNARPSAVGRGSVTGAGTGDGGDAGGGGKGGLGGGPGGAGSGKGNGTSFFGHNAVGKKFVYVLDASGSMSEYNAIAVAKSELLASLAQLDENQQFQIIFYNENCYPMRDSDRRENVFWGTETNRTRASQFIRNIEPDGGTRHLDALLMALGLTPDVIFFLTDAGEPVLYPADLDKIKRRNNGRSTIFTIEFGKGGNLRIDNFLKKLARDNGGAHAYRDVQEFQNRPDRRRGD